MNLVIDIGNTCSKWAVFNQQKLVKKGIVDQISNILLSDLFEEFPEINKAILSAVRDFPLECKTTLNIKTSRFIQLTPETPTPIINRYKSPETLGLDRLAAAIGGAALFPNTPLLIIDAGTAITIDVITSYSIHYTKLYDQAKAQHQRKQNDHQYQPLPSVLQK